MTYEGKTKLEALQELRSIRRLHEAATMRNVTLVGVIDTARAAVQAADVAQLDGLETRQAMRAVLEIPLDDRGGRLVRHRMLLDLAHELEAKKVPGVAVTPGWLRNRAMAELVAHPNRNVDKQRADGGRSA